MYPNHDYLKQISKSMAWLPALIIAGFLLITMPAWAQNVTVTYTTVGTGTVTVPANATNVTGEAWGGGGSGGGAYNSCGRTAIAGGGGGGAYAIKTYSSGGYTFNISVGQGAFARFLDVMYLDGVDGDQGDSSTCSYNGITIIANGGKGGSGTGHRCVGFGGNPSGNGGGGGEPIGGGNGSCTGTNGGDGRMNETDQGYGGGACNGGGNTSPTANGQVGATGTFPGGGGGGGRALGGSANLTVRAGGNGANGQVRITFTLKPTFEISSPVCSGQNITFTITNYEAVGTYSLYNGTTPIHTFTGNSFTTTAVAGSYTVRLQRTITHSGGTLSTSDGATNNGDEVTVNSDAQSVTVNPTPIITTQPPFTVCSGEAFSFGAAQFTGSNTIPTGTTYSWSTPTVNSDISGTPTTAASNQSAIAGTLTNSTDTNITDAVTYSVTPTTSNGCVGNPFTVTIEVKAKPIITNQTFTVCSGEAFSFETTDFTGSNTIPTGTTYSWSAPTVNSDISGTPTTAASGQSAIAGTLTNSTNTNITNAVTYSVAPTAPNGCVGNSFTVTIEVKAKPTITTQNFTVCSGEAFSFETTDFTGSNTIPTGTTFSWSAPTVNSNISGTPTTAASGQSAIAGTLTNSTDTNITDAVTYAVTPTAPNGCVGNPFTVTIDVQTVPDINLIIDLGEVCSDYNLNFTPQNGTHGIVTSSTEYKWEVLHSPNIGTINAQTTYQNAITQNSIINTGTTPEIVTFIVTYRHSSSCSSIAKTCTLTLTVKPVPVISDKNYDVCSGSAFTLVPASSDKVPVGTTYTWTVTNNNDKVTGQRDSIVAAEIMSQTLTGIAKTNQTITYTVTPTADNCTGSQFPVNVTVRPIPTVEITADNITKDENGMIQICKDKGYKFILVGNPPFTLTYSVNGKDPAEYGLGTLFDTSNISYNSAEESYIAILPFLPPGMYYFIFTKIEDSGCENN
jgi:hypothetical protein